MYLNSVLHKWVMNRFCKEIFVYTYILHSKYGKPTKQILIIKNNWTWFNVVRVVCRMQGILGMPSMPSIHIMKKEQLNWSYRWIIILKQTIYTLFIYDVNLHTIMGQCTQIQEGSNSLFLVGFKIYILIYVQSCLWNL